MRLSCSLFHKKILPSRWPLSQYWWDPESLSTWRQQILAKTSEFVKFDPPLLVPPCWSISFLLVWTMLLPSFMKPSLHAPQVTQNTALSIFSLPSFSPIILFQTPSDSCPWLLIPNSKHCWFAHYKAVRRTITPSKSRPQCSCRYQPDHYIFPQMTAAHHSTVSTLRSGEMTFQLQSNLKSHFIFRKRQEKCHHVILSPLNHIFSIPALSLDNIRFSFQKCYSQTWLSCSLRDIM